MLLRKLIFRYKGQGREEPYFSDNHRPSEAKLS